MYITNSYSMIRVYIYIYIKYWYEYDIATEMHHFRKLSINRFCPKKNNEIASSLSINETSIWTDSLFQKRTNLMVIIRYDSCWSPSYKISLFIVFIIIRWFIAHSCMISHGWWWKTYAFIMTILFHHHIPSGYLT